MNTVNPVRLYSEDDVLVGQHDHVLINGRLAQVNFLAEWTRRPHNVAALWVSEEAARVMEWAVSIKADGPDAKPGFGRKVRNAGEFSPAEAMEHFMPGRPHGDKDRREWWKRVGKELRNANMLREAGHFGHVPSEIGWETFKRPEATPEIRRLF